MRGTPKASDTAAMLKSVVCTRVMTSGMVKALKMLQWTIRSQGSKDSLLSTRQVQRLDGGRLLLESSLRYSPALDESLGVRKWEPAA